MSLQSKAGPPLSCQCNQAAGSRLARRRSYDDDDDDDEDDYDGDDEDDGDYRDVDDYDDEDDEEEEEPWPSSSRGRRRSSREVSEVLLLAFV